MRNSYNRRAAELLTIILFASVATVGACSDDEPSNNNGGSGGSTSGAGGKGSGGKASGGTAQGGDAGDTGSGGDMGGAPPDGPKLVFMPYPSVSYPPENPDSDAKAVLGKILFWDEQVGSDGTMACGTCHRTESGGSDPRAVAPDSRHPGPDGVLGTDDDVHGSKGVVRCTPGLPDDIGGDGSGGEGGGGPGGPGGGEQPLFPVTYIGDPVFGMEPQVTGRRAPSYLDAMISPLLFWDGRASSSFVDPETKTVAIQQGGALESQSVGPPLSDAEMACEGRTWEDVRQRLSEVVPLALAKDIPPALEEAITAAGGTYAKLFEAAFGTPEINARRFAFAIATHERRLVSNQTPWDRYNAGDRSALTPAQERGFELFMGKAECGVCHIPPMFTDFAFHYIGFADADADPGRQAIDPLAKKGAVKTPTLRNVGLREPQGLFHFGFDPLSVGAEGGADLESVMAAYNNPPNVDPVEEASIKPLNLTQDEIDDIIDFMRNGLTDPRVRDRLPPFDRPVLRTESD